VLLASVKYSLIAYFDSINLILIHISRRAVPRIQNEVQFGALGPCRCTSPADRARGAAVQTLISSSAFPALDVGQKT
jgi:hypothetical protein